MFKHYLPSKLGVGETYWQAQFERVDLAEAQTLCEASPLWPLFEAELVPGRVFLDGGCGAGQWVKYYSAKGYKAVGVDYVPALIDRGREFDPGLDLRLGDVRSLPFGDGEVHVYYSGGVVEHFEEGPEGPLIEARRVLHRDGRLLCSVPDAHALRRALHRKPLHLLSDQGARVRRTSSTQVEPAPDGMVFHQYLYPETEFRERLRSCGFEVIRTFGFSLTWSLFEIAGVRSAYDGVRTLVRYGRGSPAQTKGPHRSSPRPFGRGRAPLATRLLGWEDPSVPVLGPIVQRVADSIGHMRMYVARPL